MRSASSVCSRVTFERSTDYEAIRAILCEPRAWRRMVNDLAPPPGDFFPLGPVPGIEYVLARDSTGPVAVFVLVDGDEVHFAFAPTTWGNTTAIASAFVAWFFRTTSEARLIGPAPTYNRLAIRLAKAIGFRETGTVPNAVKRHGTPYDLVLLEIKR